MKAQSKDYKAPMPNEQNTRCPYPLVKEDGTLGHWVQGTFKACGKKVCQESRA